MGCVELVNRYKKEEPEMGTQWRVTVVIGDETHIGIVTDEDPTDAEYKFLDELSDKGINVDAWDEVTTERAYE